MSTSKGKTASVEELSAMIQQMTLENAELTAKLAVAAPNVTNPKEPLKVPPPTPFEGRQGTLRAFLTQARLYLRFQSSAITYTSDKVLTIAGYLRGDAAAWFEPTLREYLEKGTANKCGEKTKEVFSDYNRFEEFIKEAFGNPDEDRDYERQLLQLRQSTSAQGYASKFRQVAAHLEWDDEPLMVQYYKGLKDVVKDEISKEDRPEALGTYMERSIRIDNRLYERRLEQQNKGWTAQRRNFIRNKRHGTSYGHHAGPMELDAAIKKKEDRKCYNCGRQGHLSRDCRQPRKQFQKVPEGTRSHNTAVRTGTPGTKTVAMAFRVPLKKSKKKEKKIKTEPKEEDEEEEEPFSQLPLNPDHFGTQDWDDPARPAPIGTVTKYTIRGVAEKGFLSTLDINIMDKDDREDLLEGDSPMMAWHHRNHKLVSWAACFQNYCPEHYQHKMTNNFFPKRPIDDVPIDNPFLHEEMRHWVITDIDRSTGLAILQLDPRKPVECLKGRPWGSCPMAACKVHLATKAEAWQQRIFPRPTRQHKKDPWLYDPEADISKTTDVKIDLDDLQTVRDYDEKYPGANYAPKNPNDRIERSQGYLR